jgi:hypothetical protein
MTPEKAEHIIERLFDEAVDFGLMTLEEDVLVAANAAAVDMIEEGRCADAVKFFQKAYNTIFFPAEPFRQ